MPDNSTQMENVSERKLNVLVTGAAGFVGRHLTKKLLSENLNVFAIVRSQDKLLQFLGCECRDQLTVWNGDLLKEADLRKFEQNLNKIGELDVVVHLVGGGPLTSNKKLAPHVFDLNYTTASNLACILDRAKKLTSVPLFIYHSSLTAMGIPTAKGGQVFYDEETPCNPLLPHGMAKLKTEELLKDLASNKKLKAVVLRFPQMYGSDDDPLIPVIDLLRRGVFPVVRNRVGTLPLIHINDAVGATCAVISQRRRLTDFTLNLVCEKSYSYDFLENLVKRKYGRGGTLKLPYSLMYLATLFLETAFGIIGKPEPLNRERLHSIATNRMISCRRFVESFGFKFNGNLENFIIHELS